MDFDLRHLADPQWWTLAEVLLVGPSRAEGDLLVQRSRPSLFSNALKFRDPDKEEAWVEVVLRALPQSYEFRVSDNGLGLPAGRSAELSRWP